MHTLPYTVQLTIIPPLLADKRFLCRALRRVYNKRRWRIQRRHVPDAAMVEALTWTSMASVPVLAH